MSRKASDTRAHRTPAGKRRASRTSGALRPAHTAVVPGSVPNDATFPPPLVEPPHVHAVCRNCGRIADVDLRSSDLEGLKALSDQRPLGWTVERLTFSLTGLCPRCSAGPQP
jgi:hypothetical protein